VYAFDVWQDLVMIWRSKRREDPRPEYTPEAVAVKVRRVRHVRFRGI
jgi:hypothetical protein